MIKEKQLGLEYNRERQILKKEKSSLQQIIQEDLDNVIYEVSETSLEDEQEPKKDEQEPKKD